MVLDPGPQRYWNLETQQAIDAIGVPALDRDFVFGFGLVGLWFIVANWLARHRVRFPRLLPYIGIGAGLADWLFAAGNQSSSEILGWAGLLGGLVLLPAWLVWTGPAVPKLR